jgi:hypothetical protein
LFGDLLGPADIRSRYSNVAVAAAGRRADVELPWLIVPLSVRLELLSLAGFCSDRRQLKEVTVQKGTSAPAVLNYF